MPVNFSRLTTIPITISDKVTGSDRKTYRVLSKITNKLPTFEQKDTSSATPRQRAFESVLTKIAQALGSNRIPFRFRMPNGDERKLDEGCVGHAIANQFLTKPSNLANIEYVELAAVSRFADEADAEIERQKRLGQIARRPDQKKFSRQVRENYGDRCAASGCCTPRALQAAHVKVAQGRDYNSRDNGILLRADIHALFDSLLLTISSDGNGFDLSPALKDEVYQFLQTVRFKASTCRVRLSTESIAHHRHRFLVAISST